MNVLVTGASGFTGTWMLEYIRSLGRQDINIVGLVNTSKPKNKDATGITFVKADLLDPDHLATILSTIDPDAIIHLAGRNHGTLSNLLEINVIGTKNLLDVVMRKNTECRIIVISSSAVYGYAGKIPISEEFPWRPLSEYGISKTALEVLSHMYHQVKGAHIAVVRPFNLIGPGQPSSLICGKIIHQAMQIARGERESIDLIETRSSRDFIDVRDIVKGYWALLTQPHFKRECAGKVFNLGSGYAHSVKDIILLVEEITGRHYPVSLPEKNPCILIPTQRSDNRKIQSLTGWTPEITLRDSLKDMLDEGPS
jgi:nucleoside-diphosphate-sugar epimerase